MHIVSQQSTDEKSGSIVAYKDSYWSDFWPEKYLGEMSRRNEGKETGNLFEKTFKWDDERESLSWDQPGRLWTIQVTIGYVNKDIGVDLLLRKTRDQH